MRREAVRKDFKVGWLRVVAKTAKQARPEAATDSIPEKAQ
jgi:hypothetical protein